VKWFCQLGSDEPIEADDLDAVAEHLRLMHPDQDHEPQRWPDGDIVVVDQTLEPDDFGGDRG